MHFIDIGANLTDAVFRGKYRGKQAHDPDLNLVLSRARLAGVVRTFVTAGTLEQSKEAAELCKSALDSASLLYSTVGVHPTRANGVNPEEIDQHMSQLQQVVAENADKVVAVGECGLDYDRVQFSKKHQQLSVFKAHFDLAKNTGLPMFLHNRNTSGDFVRVMRENREMFSEGVVHSYTGDLNEMNELIDLGLYIGINGCSLKTEENLAVARKVPLDKLMLETDAPYCDIRKSHASHKHVVTPYPARDKKKYTQETLVKGRCEPCQIRQVCEVVAAVKEISPEEVARHSFNNTMQVFFKKEASDMGSSPYELSLSTGTKS